MAAVSFLRHELWAPVLREANWCTKARICTFNVQLTHPLLISLVGKDTQILVGYPCKGADKVLNSVDFGKQKFPGFSWRTLRSCHAKYYLFEKGSEMRAFVGSANLTHSGSDQEELLVECTKEQSAQILKFHHYLFKHGTPVRETPRKKLTSEQLAGILATPVRP